MHTSICGLVWTVVAAALAAGSPTLWAQAQPPARPADAAGAQDAAQPDVNLDRLAPGFGIRELSISGGLYSLRPPTSGSGGGLIETAKWMGVGTASAELGWRPASRTTLADVRYRFNQNWNNSYDDLNGMDHIFTLTSSFGAGSRWRRGISLSAESRLFSSLLFDSPVLPGSATSAASGPSTVGTSIGDTGLALNTPLVASFFGSRRNAGSAGFDVSFSKSPRTTWFTAFNMTHQMAATSSSEGASRDLLQPAVTAGTATGGLAYSATRATTIGFDVNASRSQSRNFKIMSGALMGNVTRRLNTGLSAFMRAGYSLTDEIGVPSRPARGVLGSAGITGTRGVHTVRISGYLDRMDRFAVGAERSVGGDAIWDVIGRSSPWTSSLSFGYVKVTRFNAAPVEGIVARSLVARRLSRNLSLGIDLAYSTISGRIPSLITDLTHGGARIFLSYAPQP